MDTRRFREQDKRTKIAKICVCPSSFSVAVSNKKVLWILSFQLQRCENGDRFFHGSSDPAPAAFPKVLSS